MILNLKRKRIERERLEAVGERNRAVLAFLTAVREAEAALDAIRAANNKFYRSEVHIEQSCLNQLRQDRERMFAFVTAKDVVAEAPYLARILGVRVAPTQAMPMLEWMEHVARLDLASMQPTPAKGEGA